MTVCQSAIKGILRIMSLLHVRLLGLLPRVVCIPALIACMAMGSASSIFFGIINILRRFCPCEFSTMARSHSPYRIFSNKQEKNNKKQHISCVFGLGSWLGILTWDLDNRVKTRRLKETQHKKGCTIQRAHSHIIIDVLLETKNAVLILVSHIITHVH